jgi:hypothetical protein
MRIIVEQLVEWRLAGETEVLGERSCPSATLSTTNPTWPDPGSNPGRRGGKPATNRLSYGVALRIFFESYCPSTPGCPSQTQFLVGRRHDLRICIPCIGERLSLFNMFVVLWWELFSPPPSTGRPRWRITYFWVPETPCSIRSYLLPVSWDCLFHQQLVSPNFI